MPLGRFKNHNALANPHSGITKSALPVHVTVNRCRKKTLTVYFIFLNDKKNTDTVASKKSTCLIRSMYLLQHICPQASTYIINIDWA